MLKHLFSLLLLLMLALTLAAAPRGKKKAAVEIPPDVPKTFSGMELQWVKSALSDEYLKLQISAISKDFLQGKNVTVPKLRFDILDLKRFDKYYFLESDSGLSRRWVKQNIAYAEALLKAKIQLGFLAANKQTASQEYRQWYDYYNKTAKEYWAVSRRPVKCTNVKRMNNLADIKKAVLERLNAQEAAAKAKQPKFVEEKKKK